MGPTSNSMCYPIGARLTTRQTLALEKLYHHFFSTPDHDSTSIDHLVLWLNHHSFEELSDALEYYLANPSSDLDANLTHLNLLDQRGVQVTICSIVTIYIHTLLDWAKCFLATYGEYPGLYDLLDTPRSVFLAAQLHLHDSTFPRPLLLQSRGRPTLQNEPVALHPHLAPPTPPDHLYACLHPCLSINTSVCCVTSPSVRLSDCTSTHPSVELSVCHMDTSICHTTSPSVIPSVSKLTRLSVTLSVCDTASLSIIPIHLSYNQSIQHPVNSSLTNLSVTPPISPAFSLSDHPSRSNSLYTILPCPSDCPSLSDHSSTIFTSLSDHPSPPNHLSATSQSPSACPSPSNSLITTMTHLTTCLSSNMIQHSHDSSQSLAVVNGEQPCKAKEFCRAFTNYDPLLHALDVSIIYPSDSRHVAPPKSGEDAHITCGMCDLGGPTLYRPRTGSSYILPRLWDPGGVRSTPNVPMMHRDQSRSLAASRHPYAPCKGHLVTQIAYDNGKTFVCSM